MSALLHNDALLNALYTDVTLNAFSIFKNECDGALYSEIWTFIV